MRYFINIFPVSETTVIWRIDPNNKVWVNQLYGGWLPAVTPYNEIVDNNEYVELTLEAVMLHFPRVHNT